MAEEKINQQNQNNQTQSRPAQKPPMNPGQTGSGNTNPIRDKNKM